MVLDIFPYSGGEAFLTNTIPLQAVLAKHQWSQLIRNLK
jgi:hypothetical protein